MTPAWLTSLPLPLGLGTNTFARTCDAAAAHRILDAFAAAGGTLVDTADTYTDGAAETILGGWVRARGCRDGIVLASKGGNHPDFDGLGAATITGACEASLRRLGTDRIDLYLAHFPDDATPVEESAAAFDALVRSGKVRAYGLSNVDADAVAAWLAACTREGLTPPVALQPHYSLVERSFEGELAQVAARLAVFPYRALGGGFLTGKYRAAADTEGRARGAGVRPLLTPAGLALLDVLDDVAREAGAEPASVALAWLRGRPGVVAPLASATTEAQVPTLVAGATLELTDAQAARLDAASAELTS